MHEAKYANKSLDELERIKNEVLPKWQLCSWIQDEYVLLLDDNNTAEFNGYIVSYGKEGFCYSRKEDE